MGHNDDCKDKLKVKIRQSDDGRKKKIKLENDFMFISIRIKDGKVDLDCGDDDSFHYCP